MQDACHELRIDLAHRGVYVTRRIWRSEVRFFILHSSRDKTKKHLSQKTICDKIDNVNNSSQRLVCAWLHSVDHGTGNAFIKSGESLLILSSFKRSEMEVLLWELILLVRAFCCSCWKREELIFSVGHSGKSTFLSSGRLFLSVLLRVLRKIF